MLKIIDVSEHQRRIDWSVTKDYIDGVIIRVGLGSDDPTQDDEFFEYNYAECVKRKIPFEYYLYSYAANPNMARSEAAHALRLLKGKKVRRFWYDVEDAACRSSAKANLRAFSDAMNAAGIEVGLYTYESYYNSYLKGMTAWPIWVAKYASYRPNIGTDYIGWQYTSGARLPGITANTVDCSQWYGSFAEQSAEPKPKKNQTDIYRLFRKDRHFYTLDESERDMLIADGWTYEGVAWKTTKGGHPVYRYVNGQEHIWTMDSKERVALLNSGWSKEGIAWRSNLKEAVPIYRLYNGSVGDRVYTKSKNEKKALIKAGWADEGVAFYGRK